MYWLQNINLLLSYVLYLSFESSVLAIVPAPQEYLKGRQHLRLSSFSIKASKDLDALPDLHAAIERASETLQQESHQRVIVGRGEEDRAAVYEAATLNSLHLALDESCGRDELGDISQDAVKPLEDRNEAYTLKVHEGEAFLTSCTAIGIFRGLSTFLQLVYALPPADGKQAKYVVDAPLTIRDWAAYPWRGILLDTSRNFYPLDSLKSMLDVASSWKFNQFHWHITDSHAWPLHLERYSELARKGAYSPKQTYSINDVNELTKYANARGIDVMLEIDSPGHTSSVAESHPDLVSCNLKEPWSRYANEPPSGQVDFLEPEAISLFEGIFEEVSSRTTSRYVGSGGDEINKACYESDPIFVQALQASGQSYDEALKHFVKKTHDAIRAHGRQPLVWEEVVLQHDVGLRETDTLVAVWTSSQKARAVADQKLRIIHAASDYFYLDCGRGIWLGKDTGESWCKHRSWQQMLSFDPLAGLTADQHKLVMGGQVSLWSEQADETNLDTLLWPRALAAVEVFWSGNKKGDLDNALPRLHDARYRMKARGINAIPLQPEWCALRPGACDKSASISRAQSIYDWQDRLRSHAGKFLHQTFGRYQA